MPDGLNRAFSMLRTFCLLLILVSAITCSAQEPQADPKARALLREAYERRYRWDAAFPGFAGKISVAYQGMERAGTARVTAASAPEVTLPDTRAATWARDALRALALPLRHAPFEEGDGKYPVTFGPADTHPSGRALRLHDENNTLYRIRDGQVWRIEREEGPAGDARDRVTLDFLDFARTEEGLLLPRSFTIAHREAGTSRLQRTETISDTYQRVGDYYLPYTRREVVAEDGGAEVRWLRLTELKLSP